MRIGEDGASAQCTRHLYYCSCTTYQLRITTLSCYTIIMIHYTPSNLFFPSIECHFHPGNSGMKVIDVGDLQLNKTLILLLIFFVFRQLFLSLYFEGVSFEYCFRPRNAKIFVFQAFSPLLISDIWQLLQRCVGMLGAQGATLLLGYLGDRPHVGGPQASLVLGDTRPKILTCIFIILKYCGI